MNTKIKSVKLNNVLLKDPYFVNAFSKEVDYLLSIDDDRMLAGFRENAGLDMKGATRYDGWEALLIGGHTFGHYMTALVQAYESKTSTGEEKEKLLSKLYTITNGLKECQDAVNTGFIFAGKIIDKDNIEKQFDNVEELKGEIFTEAWVPWYTLHKIIEGLVSLSKISDEKLSKLAITIVDRLGDWVYKRVSSWDEETHKKIFVIEYGGMNDCMYDVYKITGKKEHLEAAHAFDEEALFEKVMASKSGENVLENVHANTTIPKYLGAINRYLVTGDKKYFDYVEKFWNYVMEDHTYITGGNSEWEHFRKDRMLDAVRTNCNCETCNVYNFLKLTKTLFMITGDVKYADAYDNAFTNQILSSQNPKTGMTTYFQPMSSGYFKTYSTRYTKFWCCTGSGMENFSKLGDSFYYTYDDGVVINQYVAMNFKALDTEFEVEADLLNDENVKITLKDDYSGKLYLRLPSWLGGKAAIKVDNKEISFKECGLNGNDKGYALLEGSFAKGVTITVNLPMKVKAYSLPDSDNTLAFKYGPFVLSACLGSKDMEEGLTGVDVTIPQQKVFEKKYIPSESEEVKVLATDVKSFAGNISGYFAKESGGEYPTFVLKGTDSNLTYMPHFAQHKERYGIYLKFIG